MAVLELIPIGFWLVNPYIFSFGLSYRKSLGFYLCECLPRARKCSESLGRLNAENSWISCPCFYFLDTKETRLGIDERIYFDLYYPFSRMWGWSCYSLYKAEALMISQRWKKKILIHRHSSYVGSGLFSFLSKYYPNPAHLFF